jgi:hypothetical protein
VCFSPLQNRRLAQFFRLASDSGDNASRHRSQGDQCGPMLVHIRKQLLAGRVHEIHIAKINRYVSVVGL